MDVTTPEVSRLVLLHPTRYAFLPVGSAEVMTQAGIIQHIFTYFPYADLEIRVYDILPCICTPSDAMRAAQDYLERRQLGVMEG